jgi:uncharacterized NAD(P)/FAD-binding protein YdhS
MPVVVVAGGGFCGGFFAAELARLARGPLRIVVIEPRPVLGAGVAYSAADPAHRINVPAARMTLFADRPADFDCWVRAQDVLREDPAAEWEGGALYPQRRVFARYVSEIIAARGTARPEVSIDHVRSSAVAATPHGQGFSVTLQDGGSLSADALVLAVSHPPPRPPALIAALGDDPAVIANPWAPGALDGLPSDAEILIVGTGLTMADMIASLDRRGHRGRVLAFSRRGQLSRGHAVVATPFTRFAEAAPPRSLRELTRLIRTSIAAEAAQGRPWQAVFDDLRANAGPLWRALDLADRQRFLRHLRPFWDAHRYRVAPQVEQAVQSWRAAGRLTVLAASLRGIERRARRLEALLHPRGAPPEERRRVMADAVIVTTGPAHGDVIGGNKLLASLAAQGILQADPLGLGIAVDEAGRVRGADGAGNPALVVAGPLARAQYGELMGMPQVAAQPSALAGDVAAWLAEMDALAI